METDPALVPTHKVTPRSQPGVVWVPGSGRRLPTPGLHNCPENTWIKTGQYREVRGQGQDYNSIFSTLCVCKAVGVGVEWGIYSK